MTQSKTVGPNVFVDCLAESTLSDIGPHHRYSEGILFDSVKGGDINVQNRRSSGTGHGWVGAQIVLWNCLSTKNMVCDSPKAAMNFAIGCVGNRKDSFFSPDEPFGFWESRQVHVTPRSLYYKQLEDRLGANAYLTVTNKDQIDGFIWNELSQWAGDNEVEGLPSFVPLQVEAGENSLVELGVARELNAIIRYPLPSNFPVLEQGWVQLSGPSASFIGDMGSSSVNVVCSQPGRYVFKYRVSQLNDMEEGNPVTYMGEDTVQLEVPAFGSILNPQNFISMGSIENSTGSLVFNTDTLELSGGMNGTGQIGVNRDGSFVAVFPFDEVNIAVKPVITGTRPIVIMSLADMDITTSLEAIGGNGSHGAQGEGVAGGMAGGDANRTDLTPGNSSDGQGLGGSIGNVSGNEDSSSGGGSYGGVGGSGTDTGGAFYGDQAISSLIGGSGAGGTRNKGGGAGGGAIGLVAGGNIHLSTSSSIDVCGGDGASSGSQYTSGGGSGGSLLIRGHSVVIEGTLNANGGNGGNASGSQRNGGGGGGGGGRISVLYTQSIDISNATMTVDGGISVGSNSIGMSGGEGTIFTGLDSQGMANDWLSLEAGVTSPEASDWLIDYDNDGLDARLEYALGGSPTTFDNSLLPRLESDGSGGYEYVFRRRKSGIDYGDYQIETSETLHGDDWVRLYSTVLDYEGGITDDDFEEVSVPFSNDQRKHFIRLSVR